MITTLVGLLILVLVLGLVYGLVNDAPVEPKFKKAAILIFIILAIIVLLTWLPYPILGPHNRL